MKKCSVKSCEGRHKGHGLCNKHLQRMRTRGTVEDRPLRPKHWATIYSRWYGMWRRCTDPKSQSWGRYGGRGITVSSHWDTPEKFYEWSMSSGFSPDLTLDRIDNNLGYIPDNCRWATRKEQVNNRECSRTLLGRVLEEVCAERGIPLARARQRMARGETDPDRILHNGTLFDSRERDSSGKFVRRVRSFHG